MNNSVFQSQRINDVIGRRKKFAVFPLVCADHCARIFNKEFKDVANDFVMLAETLKYGYSLYKYDMVLVFSDPYVEAEAMGCSLEYAPYPRLKHSVKYSPDKLIKISQSCVNPEIMNRITTSPNHDRREVIINAARLLKESLDVPVFVSIKGPFTLACFITGIEDFLKLLLHDESQAKSVIERTLNFQRDYLKKLLQIPVHIFIGDPLASSSVISPLLFEKYAFEPLRILVREIKENGMNAGIHICGYTKPIIDILDRLNADILSIEDITLKTKTLKMGGVSTSTLLHGDREQIRNEIESALKEDFLILSTSCDVSVNTPSENIKTMIDIARSYEV
ncbi:MAG: hypothetical protein N3A65_07805 [candidate division WOR-3 bacterium]|nr:hypothetical protein [candidate division WOR-3 bacterium]